MACNVEAYGAVRLGGLDPINLTELNLVNCASPRFLLMPQHNHSVHIIPYTRLFHTFFGGDTILLQLIHSRMGPPSFLDHAKFSRSSPSTSIAAFCILAMSLEKIYRQTLKIPWFGRCGFLWPVIPNVTVESTHSGSEHRCTVSAVRQSTQTILDPVGLEKQFPQMFSLRRG